VIDEPEERDRALATIGAESERMARLIGQLLDLAPLESGQTRLTLRPVPVPPLLDGVARRFRPDAERRAVALAVAAPLGLAALGDEERMAQVVGNLVGNALRFTPRGGAIEVPGAPLSTLDGGRLGVRLGVRDTGAGIASEWLPRIFDRFVPGDGPEAGFELGLAIVGELVQAHGGTIAVQSEVGRGTTFTVDLPAAPLEPAIEAEHRNGREPQRGAGS
jgi:signal transduction histidine kinase